MQKDNKKVIYIILLAFMACAIFAIFALFVTSNYFITSGLKILLFTCFPLAYFLFLEKGKLAPHFARAHKKHLLTVALLGGLTLIFIILAFLILQDFFSRETILAKILDNNITSRTYPIVFIYIVFINAFLEEFFFRGFLFLNLHRLSRPAVAHIVSALMFSLYHVTIVIGAVGVPMLLLMLVGLFAAGVFFGEAARRSHSIWCGLIIHVGANIALNSIVAYYFYFV